MSGLDAPESRTVANVKRRNRTKQWLVFVGIAVLVHLALFFYIKPSFFLAFQRTTLEDPTTAPRGTGIPDAIVYIPIEFTDSEQRDPVEEISDEPAEDETIDPTDEIPPPESGAPSQPDITMDNLLGEASHTLPQGPGARSVQIPPRPLEITWPDTRELKHCLGHQIDVRIEVDENGDILQVRVVEEGHPPDCVFAALEAAREIVFAPGKINGKPAVMWTQIRIDFKKRK
jgi:hypothetical protein